MQLDIQRFQLGLIFAQLGFGEFLHLRIGQHFLRGGDVPLGLLIGVEEFHYRAEFGVLAREFAVMVEIARDIRCAQ